MELTPTEALVQRFIRRLGGLGDVVDQEPALMKILVVAASQTNHRDRWKYYETLKYVAKQYVGWGARNLEIKNARSYELMVTAIDLLLPAPEIEDMEEDPTNLSLNLLRDAIVRSVPQAKLPDLVVERSTRQSEMVDIGTAMKGYIENLKKRSEAYQEYLRHQETLSPEEDDNT